MIEPFVLYQTQEPAKAPEGGEGAPAPPQGNPWFSMLPFILMFVVMWFLLFRPQRKQAKEREMMISNLKKNDHVLTNGGIFGIVDRVKDNEVVLKIDEKNDVRVRVAKSAIAAVVKVSGTEEGPAAETAPEAKS